MNNEPEFRGARPPFAMTPVALALDPSISGNAKALYTTIDTYTEGAKQEAFPSRSRLAENMGCTVNTIDRWIKELEVSGWLTRTSRRAKNDAWASTVYTLQIHKQTPSPTHGATPQTRSESNKNGGTLASPVDDPSIVGDANLASPVGDEQEPLEQEPLEQEPSEQEKFKTIVQTDKSVSTSNADPTPSDEELFEEFWEVYDKKEGRKKALAKWKLALKKKGVTPQLLIDAASEYIEWQESESKHPEFTKHAATWLNGEHWEDERAEPRKPVNKTSQRIWGNASIAQDLNRQEYENLYDQSNQPLIRQIGK